MFVMVNSPLPGITSSPSSTSLSVITPFSGERPPPDADIAESSVRFSHLATDIRKYLDPPVIKVTAETIEPNSEVQREFSSDGPLVLCEESVLLQIRMRVARIVVQRHLIAAHLAQRALRGDRSGDNAVGLRVRTGISRGRKASARRASRAEAANAASMRENSEAEVSRASLDLLKITWKRASELDLLPSNYIWLAMRAVFGRSSNDASKRLHDFFIEQGFSPEMRFSELKYPRLYIVSSDLNSGQPVASLYPNCCLPEYDTCQSMSLMLWSAGRPLKVASRTSNPSEPVSR